MEATTMGAEPARPFKYDPFAKAVMQDPLPFYKVLRRDHPAYYVPEYDTFFFSRFNDIVEMLSYVDNTFLESEGSLPTPAMLRAHHNDAGPPPAPPSDPFPSAQRFGMPVYGEIRRAQGAPLKPGAAQSMAGFVRDLANARLDALLPTGRFDLTREYGGIVSASVIMKLLDLPLDLAAEALDTVNSGSRTDPETGGVDAAIGAAKSMAMFIPRVQERIDAGADGSVPLIDGLVRYRADGRALTAAEIAQQLVCVFIGGIETAPKIVAHGLMELAAQPDQLAAVRQDLDANVPKAVEEMIRYCAPAQWFMRTAHKPVTIAGQTIRPGQRAIFLVASALRDEREFDAPDEFRWDREIKRVLSFGHGMHYCIGVHLARMEIRVMIDTFLRRVPAFHIDTAAAVRHPSSFQWGWNALPVVVGRA
jgi:cytochrome P450